MSRDWADVLKGLGKDVPPVGEDENREAPWELYRDLARTCTEKPTVIAQVGQSLDGRIATASGHSHYVNGPESLDHLHRLRAIADAVIVGAATAELDNPRLTTRRVPGPNPVRVVIDPNRRVPMSHSLFKEADAETLIVTEDMPGALPSHCGMLTASGADGQVVPDLLLEALRERGLRTILIEGGGRTISGFLAAGLVNRLQVAVAPMIIGSGRPGLVLPEIEKLDAALRFETRTYALGADTLFDCRLS
ncbi:RibD family protein [Nisaea acidiphila]|uniref:RibD family protein n=1 Tax=Nisaea acidiphila TaxID=1862145 RepID=A0A9J7AS97_9PROT|nr:RibD family protein [Nisaea acidiphila]UUX49204.1 RibD family protein [Nisaea acidiphila]